ncbi:MAG TPA: hypothetical protein VF379_05555 [Gaiellaceae bacterium]
MNEQTMEEEVLTMGGRGKEIARRAADGVVVSLLWRRNDGRLTVVVNDTRTGELLKLPAERENALEVYYHPYAYTGTRAA